MVTKLLPFLELFENAKFLDYLRMEVLIVLFFKKSGSVSFHCKKVLFPILSKCSNKLRFLKKQKKDNPKIFNVL